MREERRALIRADKVIKAKRRHRVMELRAAGLTYEQISEQMGDITTTGVRRIIKNQLKKWAHDNQVSVAEYREQKLFELDQLKRAIWPDALRGDTKAVREAARIIKLQAEVSGASAPQRIEHTGKIGIMPEIDPAEIKRMEEAWLQAAPQGPIPDAEVIEEVPALEASNGEKQEAEQAASS